MIADEVKQENILLRRNSTFAVTLTYRVDGVIQPTNGYKAYMQFRPYPGAPRMLFQASSENGMITFGGEDGKIYINIPKEKTRDMPRFNKGYYDLLVIFPSGSAKAIMKGLVTFDESSVTLVA
jgi:hypothetical protein